MKKKIVIFIINLLLIIFFVVNQRLSINIRYYDNVDFLGPISYNDSELLTEGELVISNSLSSGAKKYDISLFKIKDIRSLHLKLNAGTDRVIIRDVEIKYNNRVVKSYQANDFFSINSSDIGSITIHGDNNLYIENISSDGAMSTDDLNDEMRQISYQAWRILSLNIFIFILFLFVFNLLFIRLESKVSFDIRKKTAAFSKLTMGVLLIIFGCILLISVKSSYNSHPDESVSGLTGAYYKENIVPPHILSDEIEESFSIYGGSRFRESTFYYQFAGLFSNISDWVFQGSAAQSMRMLNNILFIIMILISSLSRKRAPLFITLVSVSQLWYMYSYVTSDAWDFFFSFITLYFIAHEDSLLNKYLNNDELLGKKNVIKLILISIVFGCLLLAKYNYYTILIFVFFILLIKLIFSDKNIRIHLFKKYCIILGGTMLFIGLRYLQLEIIHNFRYFESVNEAVLLNRIPDIEEHTMVNLYQRGFTFHEFMQLDWANSSFQSFFGAFGYLEFKAPQYLYVAAGILYGILFGVGSICYIKYSSKKAKAFAEWTAIILTIILTIGLSIYNSWFVDFQAQGRYLMPILIMVGYLFLNYSETFGKKMKAFICILVTLLVIINLFIFINYGVRSFL